MVEVAEARWRGPMTIAQERQLRARGCAVRVLVRGEDVTARCRFANDATGAERAELYRLTVDGRKHRDEDRQAAIEVATADVEIYVSAPC